MPAARLPIVERLQEFYRRLQVAPKAASAEEALDLLCQTLEQVEDELSGIAKATPAPDFAFFDGRMYRSMDDFTFRRPDGSILALTRGHRIEISADGGIQIIKKVSKQVEFLK